MFSPTRTVLNDLVAPRSSTSPPVLPDGCQAVASSPSSTFARPVPGVPAPLLAVGGLGRRVRVRGVVVRDHAPLAGACHAVLVTHPAHIAAEDHRNGLQRSHDRVPVLE